MASLENIMLLKKIAEEYCEKRRYSIEGKSIEFSDEKLKVWALDANMIRHSLEIKIHNILSDDISIEDMCGCEYVKSKNIFKNYREIEIFRGKDFQVETSNLWMDVYSKLLLEAGKRNMEEKGGVWLDIEMYVAELANIYCDFHDKYDVDKIEKFIEEQFV